MLSDDADWGALDFEEPGRAPLEVGVMGRIPLPEGGRYSKPPCVECAALDGVSIS